MRDIRDLPKRKVVRLPDYDYSQLGWYYITLCSDHCKCIFGSVRDGQMHANRIGQIVEQEWMKSFTMRSELELDCCVLMPNHLHAVVVIRPESAIVTTTSATIRPRSLSSFIAGFKGASAKAVNELRATPAQAVWQRSFWEHVVRTEEALLAIRQYIADNPLAWWYDKYNTDRVTQ